MSSSATIRDSRVVDIVGSENVVTGSKEISAYSVDGVAPQIAARPSSAQEVSDLVQFAAAENLAVIPTGARTKLAIGMPPSRYDLAIDMTRLDRIVSYDPGDLTLSVEPGIRLARLTATLAEHSQFLPLDVPFYDRATVGGTLASGVDSPLREAYGTARDFVLGMEFASGDGALTKSGGRVVKNVSGYDLHKLFLGSIGSLGIITRVNFKTFPLPRTTVFFAAAFRSASAAAAFNALIHKSPLRCHRAEIFSGKAAEVLDVTSVAKNTDWRVALSVAGNEAVIARTERDLEAMARRASQGPLRDFRRLEAADGETLCAALRDFPVIATTTRDAIIVKLGCVPASVADICEATAAIAERHSFEIAQIFRANGVGYLALFAPHGGTAQLKPCCEEILSAASKAAAQASIPWCSLELKRELSVWGPPREDFLLMQGVKRAFDPHNIFAPGRFVGGL